MSETERQSNDRRRTDTLRTNAEVMERSEAETTHGNPEVMGRSEPATMTATRQPEQWSEMSDIRTRFEQLQSEFIDDPKAAVQKVEALLDDAFNKMRDRINNIHSSIQKTDDTENLRLAMRSYRDMIDSLGGRRSQ
jgi:hypothetical protein